MPSPLLPSLSQISLLSMMSIADIVWDIPLTSLGQLFWLCPSIFLCTQPPCWLDSRRCKKVLASMQTPLCSVLLVLSVCYHHRFHQKSKTQHIWVSTKKTNSVLAKILTVLPEIEFHVQGAVISLFFLQRVRWWFDCQVSRSTSPSAKSYFKNISIYKSCLISLNCRHK